VSFLPDILDTGADGRNALIEIQKGLAERNKRRPFGWVWTVANKQAELQKAFDIGGFGFPALTAFNSKKKKFATLRGAFTQESIQEFVNRLVCTQRGHRLHVGHPLPPFL
jgi:protein disulfide-isomerase A6